MFDWLRKKKSIPVICFKKYIVRKIQSPSRQSAEWGYKTTFSGNASNQGGVPILYYLSLF